MPTPLTLPRQVGRLRRRSFAAVFFETASRHATWLLVGAGVALILARRFTELGPDHLRWFFALPLLALLSAAHRAWTQRPSPADAAVWLDVHGGGNGVLVTAAERPGSDTRAWQETLDRSLRRAGELPAVPIGRPARRVLPALVFAVLCQLLQVPSARPPGPPVHLFQTLLGGARQKLDALTEAGGLDPEQQREFQERLTQLADSVQQGNAEAWFSALDRIGADLESEGGLLRQNGLDLITSLARAANSQEGAAVLPMMAGALEQLRGLGIESVDDLQGLLDGLEAAGLEVPGLDLSQLDLSGLELGNLRLDEQGLLRALSAAQMRSMAGDLREAVGQRFEQLSRSGLFQPLGALAKLGRGGDPAGGSGTGPGPGGGATSPWADEPSERAGLFQPRRLPPGAIPDPESSAALGHTLGGSPEAEPRPAGEAAGLVELEATTGAGTWRRRLHPAHRRAVERFFTEPTNE